jgi:hypothetical protein
MSLLYFKNWPLPVGLLCQFPTWNHLWPGECGRDHEEPRKIREFLKIGRSWLSIENCLSEAKDLAFRSQLQRSFALLRMTT